VVSPQGANITRAPTSTPVAGMRRAITWTAWPPLGDPRRALHGRAPTGRSQAGAPSRPVSPCRVSISTVMDPA